MGTSSKTEEERALLKKYLAGNATPEEKERLDAWYNSFDNAPLPGSVQEELSMNKVKRALLEEVHGTRPHKIRLFYTSIYFKVAAMLALAVSISLIIYRTVESPANFNMQYHAANGQTKIIRLDDGSVVTLNSGSDLKILSDFKQHTREIYLSGEGYFQVAKDRLRPFIVNTGIVKTRVLGTSFNVQAYKNEAELTVTVAEGKVQVDRYAANSKPTNLSPGVTPGKQLIYNRNAQTARVIPADAAHIGAWRTGTIYIDNESIPAIARRLERKFNIKIDVKGQTKPSCRYTLRIGDEKLNKILEVLTVVSGITCTYNQPNHLTLNMALCK